MSEGVQDIAALVRRRDGQRKWLSDNHPAIFVEQKHCQEGMVERAYWHYGYMVALTDVLKFIGAEPAAKQGEGP